MIKPLPGIQVIVMNYENHKTKYIRRRTAEATEWIPQRGYALFPYAVPCHNIEEPGQNVQGSWRSHRYVGAISQQMGEKIPCRGLGRIANQTGPRSQAHNGRYGHSSSKAGDRGRYDTCEEYQRGMAECNRQGSRRVYIQTFFRSLGARFGRIRLRPKGKSSPHFHEWKVNKLQELEGFSANGLIDLYYGDESHVCTQGYVPYGWKLPWVDVHVPAQKGRRLNIFGMISRDNRYHGFTTEESINADKFISFIDSFSLSIKKKTFVVLYNSTVHRNKKINDLRAIWEERGLYIFFLPSYSPELNIAETLWRVLKTKWLLPADYVSADYLFYAATMALANVGTMESIAFSPFYHNAA